MAKRKKGKKKAAIDRIHDNNDPRTKKGKQSKKREEAHLKEALFELVSNPSGSLKQETPLYQNPIAGPGLSDKNAGTVKESNHLETSSLSGDESEHEGDDKGKGAPDHPPSFPKSEYAVDPDVFEEEDKEKSSGKAIRDILVRRESLSSVATTTPSKSDGGNGDSPASQLRDEGFKEFTPVSNVSQKSNKRKASELNTPSNLESKFDSNVVPWMGNSSIWADSAEIPVIHLHNEIVRLTQLLGPTKEETNSRQEIVDGIRAVADDIFPDSRTEVFGSFSTDLCLPESDVDVVLFLDNKSGNAIYKLANEFRRRSMVDYMEVIDKARVPIIKLRFRGNPITADICFNQESGPETKVFIQSVLKFMPEIRPLTMTIKYYLAQRGLNETFNGGMGSYLCFLTVVSVVQHARRRVRYEHIRSKTRFDGEKSLQKINLGTLLLEYFEVYGRMLQMDQVAISLRDGGRYYSKSHSTHRSDPRDRGPRLSIDNPSDPSVDVGKGTYQIGVIKKAFGHAHETLTALLASHPTDGNVSILEAVIAVDDVLKKRQLTASGLS